MQEVTRKYALIFANPHAAAVDWARTEAEAQHLNEKIELVQKQSSAQDTLIANLQEKLQDQKAALGMLTGVMCSRTLIELSFSQSQIKSTAVRSWVDENLTRYSREEGCYVLQGHVHELLQQLPIATGVVNALPTCMREIYTQISNIYHHSLPSLYTQGLYCAFVDETSSTAAALVAALLDHALLSTDTDIKVVYRDREGRLKLHERTLQQLVQQAQKKRQTEKEEEVRKKWREEGLRKKWQEEGGQERQTKRRRSRAG
mmetsp:Transcript_27243/g.50011  ORF Transcript_27243/g.50011 Transcript_27243/m.50011 type:complete len:259 (+) Transcript_27243:70-846(+)